jgi:hypothetical protein
MPIDFNSYSKLPQFGLSVVSQKKKQPWFLMILKKSYCGESCSKLTLQTSSIGAKESFSLAIDSCSALPD